MATLTISDSTVSDTNNQGTGSGIQAQGFKIPSNATITGVGIKGSQGASASGTFKIEIYEGGASPTAGTLKKTETYTTTSVLPVYTPTPTMQTINFTTGTGTLTGGSIQYYLCITALTGSASDETRWSFCNPGTYPDGTTWIGGSEFATLDNNFAIYGTIGEGVVLPQPTLLTLGVG